MLKNDEADKLETIEDDLKNDVEIKTIDAGILNRKSQKSGTEMQTISPFTIFENHSKIPKLELSHSL